MRSRTSATLILLLAFLLGSISGAVGHYLYQKKMIAAVPHPKPGSHDIAEEMARDLGLDAVQKEKLRAIIVRSRESYRALWEQFRPQYDALRKQTRQEMREILNDDQKARFENKIQEMDSRRRPPRRSGAP